MRKRSVVAAAVTVSLVLSVIGWVTAGAAASPAGSAEAGPGPAAPRSAVPWKLVGPGWALAIYNDGTTNPLAPTTSLYLLDPRGGKYTLRFWPANARYLARIPLAEWTLRAWSGDGDRALLTTTATPQEPRQHVYQLDLKTGRGSSLSLAEGSSVIGYTRPSGTGILVQAARPGTFIIYPRHPGDLAGPRRIVRLAGSGLAGGVYSANGKLLAVPVVPDDLKLVRGSGRLVRTLPVPDALNCEPVRWWTPSTILASCNAAANDDYRLWLVPASGARPAALTPQRPLSGPDQGDFNAWQLAGSLYLNAEGPNCKGQRIARRLGRGGVRIIKVPGYRSAVIVAATASRLLVQLAAPCQGGGSSLAWFNPATRSLAKRSPCAITARTKSSASCPITFKAADSESPANHDPRSNAGCSPQLVLAEPDRPRSPTSP
jgi:hypothetical protein